MPDSPSDNVVNTVLLVPDRVMRISEMQNLIFSFNGVGDAARYAVVCKAWTEVALNLMWHTLPSMRPLFNILAPLTSYQYSESFDFSRKIRPSDRIRFSSYVPRIKFLTIKAKPDFPCESALNELLKSRLEASLLPNLKKFHINTCSKVPLQLAVPFLHDRVEDLLVDGLADSCGGSDVEIFLEEIALRSPKLQKYEFLIQLSNAGRIPNSLSQLLENQASLEAVFLAPGMLTSSVLESLSCLPKVEQITIVKKYVEQIDLSALQSISCGQDNGGNIFQALRFLDLQTRLTSAASLISAHSSFARLYNLSIDMIFHNDAEDLQKCLEIISQTCAVLGNLEFSRFSDNGNRRAVLDEERNPITTKTLAPLKSFLRLRHFSLTHTQCVVISDDDLVQLLSCCHPLCGLHLNPTPIQVPPSTMVLPTLGSLHRIAQCQPKLKYLSLYLNVSIADNSDLLYNRSVHSNPFSYLETLNLGKSDVRDVNGPTLYLCQVLPPGCKLKYDNDRYMSARRWKEVTERLPSLQRLYAEQRRRIHELESMVGTLRHQLEANVDAAVQGIASVIKLDGQKKN